MLDEGTLRARFPEIAWDQPVEVHILSAPATFRKVGDHTVFVTGEETYHWACRYCVAMHGLKAQDVIYGRAAAAVFPSREEALDHIDQQHHD